MDYIVPGIGLAVIIGLFVAGWILGGRNREKSIALKGLKDVNAHYQKMAEDYKTVDHLVDGVNSKLDDGLRARTNRRSRILTPK